ncbi:MAG: helix-turn-helix transcriptional regulator [Bacilli bacterium]|nr:helix-turn-helix transcriptional regulator [Bacilli bacterium]MBP3258676.1 helix-turn-helix transcriptional regulator [Bacilli bacterium]
MRKIYTPCPVEYTASMIANKWKILILRDLLTGTKRYNELTRSVVGISAKVLTENLRELESDGIIERKVYPEVPPKVEYFLTDKGNDLRPIIELMKEYGLKYKDKKDE